MTTDSDDTTERLDTPASRDETIAGETVTIETVLRFVFTRLRRNPVLAAPFIVAGLLVSLADWLRKHDPVSFVTPETLGDTFSIQYSMIPMGTARTARNVGALVDLRVPYFVGAAGLELLVWVGLGVAGWLTFSRALGVKRRLDALARYLAVSGLLAALSLVAGSSSVSVDSLPIMALTVFIYAFVSASLFLFPGSLVTGKSIPAGLLESVRASRGNRWTLFGLVVVLGLAYGTLAKVPVAGGFLSTAVVAPVHAVSFAAFLPGDGDATVENTGASGPARRER
jgi:hypothetical protein